MSDLKLIKNMNDERIFVKQIYDKATEIEMLRNDFSPIKKNYSYDSQFSKELIENKIIITSNNINSKNNNIDQFHITNFKSHAIHHQNVNYKCKISKFYKKKSSINSSSAPYNHIFFNSLLFSLILYINLYSINSFNLNNSPKMLSNYKGYTSLNTLINAQSSSSQQFSSQRYPTKLRTAERSINKICLMGRLGADPEIRKFPNGDRFAVFSLATSESWRDKLSGDLRVRTEWHRVCVYDSMIVEILEKYARKGKRTYLEGTLQSRRWMTPEGQERTITEVVLPRFRSELILLEGNDDSQYVHTQSNAENNVEVDNIQQSNNGLYDRVSQS